MLVLAGRTVLSIISSYLKSMILMLSRNARKPQPIGITPSLHIKVLIQIVSQGLSHLPRHLNPRHVDSHRAHSHPIVALQGRLRLSSFAEVWICLTWVWWSFNTFLWRLRSLSSAFLSRSQDNWWLGIRQALCVCKQYRSHWSPDCRSQCNGC